MIIRSHVSCLESHGERLVAPPVRREDGAEEVGAVCPDQLAGVIRQNVHHVPGVRSWPEGPRGGHGPVAVSKLTAGEGRGGRREPSGGGRLYGNMHHNSLGQCHLTGLFFFFIRRAGLFGRKKNSFCSSRRWWSQESTVWEQRMRRRERTKSEWREPRYLSRNNKLWWLCARSSAQDVSAWGTSGVALFFTKFSKSEQTTSPKSLTVLILSYIGTLICRTLDGHFQPRVHNISDYLSSHFEISNQSMDPLKIIYCRSVTICWQ